jgi:hypothetical protein
MKAIALEPGTTNVYLTEVEEPQINQPDEVKTEKKRKVVEPMHRRINLN